MSVARVNGAIGNQETFIVSPSAVTSLVVDGSDSLENPDSLRLRTTGEISIRRLATDNSSGSVIASQGLPVHFYGIEDVGQDAVFPLVHTTLPFDGINDIIPFEGIDDIITAILR